MARPNRSSVAVVAKVSEDHMPQIRAELGTVHASGGAVAIPVIPADENVDEASPL